MTYKPNLLSIWVVIIIWLIGRADSACWKFYKEFSTPNVIGSIDYSPDGNYLAVLQTNLGLSIYRTSDFSYVNSTNLNFSGSFGIAVKYSHDQSLIAYAGNHSLNTPVVIVNADSGLTLYKIIPTTLTHIH